VPPAVSKSAGDKPAHLTQIVPNPVPVSGFGVLQPQEVILGLFGEYVGPKEAVWSGGLVQILGNLGFSVQASRIALSRVVIRGLLQPMKSGRFVHYTMTPRIAAVHAEGRRQTFSRQERPDWDGTWTLVWYSIPDRHRAERSRLGRWLNFRGFGALQDGTWIAPGDCERDIRPLIRQLGLEAHSIVFTVQTTSKSDVESIIKRAWDIKELSQMYELFLKELAPFGIASTLRRLDPLSALVLRTRIIEMFRQTAAKDLNLPDEVLMVRWRRREAVKLFHKVQNALLPKASAYFRQVAIDNAPSETP
jgi:phenylacetic acid degradation operon negative regulatory protein